jgi:hypothetical protein
MQNNMATVGIVFLCIAAVVVIIGGMWFTLAHKESGYAVFGVITMALVLIGILILKVW